MYGMKDTVINILLLIAALAVVALGAWYLSPESRERDADVETHISEREIIDFTVQEDVFGSSVTYAYVGEPLPEKLHENEVVAMRTASSFTVHTGMRNEGEEDEEVLLEVASFAQQAFIQRDGEWFYIEHDTLPKDVFDAATQTPLSWLRGALAEAVTIYSAAGDGNVGATNTTWALARGATTGTNVAPSGTSAVANSVCSTISKSLSCSINRIFLPFDTSSIPANATINSASLTVNVSSVTNGVNNGLDYITVVQTTQATHTTLVGVDFDNVGGTEGIAVGQRKDLTGLAAGAQTFTLNATGLSWIKKAGEASACSATAGITCLGLREGHDFQNSQITDNISGNSLSIYASEQTGTAQDPYLSISYTVPAISFAFWQFSDI